MNMSSVSIRILFLFLLTGYWGMTQAEVNAESLKQQIQKRSAKINEFRVLLNDPDQTVRLAALDVMLKSDDIAMRELAYGVGFNSADMAMRAISLKNKIDDQKIISVKIFDIPNPSKTEKKALSKWGGIYNFEISDFDMKRGNFKTAGSNRKGTGQLNGIRLEFDQHLCSGIFKLGDGAMLEGEIGCTSGLSGKYKGVIHLQ